MPLGRLRGHPFLSFSPTYNLWLSTPSFCILLSPSKFCWRLKLWHSSYHHPPRLGHYSVDVHFVIAHSSPFFFVVISPTVLNFTVFVHNRLSLPSLFIPIPIFLSFYTLFRSFTKINSFYLMSGLMALSSKKQVFLLLLKK